MDAKEDIRERLAIEDVIGEYVQLKRAGRTWKGLSPFSAEKTPSFVVSPDKQIWHDFSSGRGGDWKNPKDYQHFEKKSPSGNGAPYCK
jgi:DNA primase